MTREVIPSCGWQANTRRQKRDPGKELRKAAETGDPRKCDELLRSGVSVDNADKGGRTTLHYAARAGKISTTAFLLKNGADPNALEKHGGRPCDEADHWYVKSKCGNNPADEYLRVIEILALRGGSRSDAEERQKREPAFRRRRGQLENMAASSRITVPWKVPQLLALEAPAPALLPLADAATPPQPAKVPLGFCTILRDYHEPPERRYLPVHVGDRVEITFGTPLAGEPSNCSAWYVFGRSDGAQGWLAPQLRKC